MRISLLLILAALTLPATDIYHISGHGQSLCTGTNGTPALSTTQPYANKLLSSGGTVLGPLVESGPESPFSSMANQITSLLGLQIVTEARNVGNTDPSLATNDCVGGQAYAALKKGTNPYAQWLNVLAHAPATATAAGLNYKYGGGFVVHGEQDFTLGTTAAQYEADLVAWQSNIQSDVHSTLGTNGTVPLLVSQMSSWTVWNSSGLIGAQPLICQFSACNGTQGQNVPLGQLQAARDNPGLIYFLGPKYQYTYADTQHLTNAGYRQLGELAGKAWKQILGGGAYWTGLVPRSITISGTTVTLKLWVPAGSVTLDTTTLSDASQCQGVATSDPAACTTGGGFWTNKGFEWWDGSGTSKPYISSVTVTASDTITIALSAMPSGANQRLRYAFTGTGHLPGAAATAPHGNVRDTDTTVGVSSGAHLYDWLATFDDPVGFSWSPPMLTGVFPLPSGFRR